MEQIYDSRHSGQEVDNAVDAVQTTIPNQLTQIGLKLGDLEATSNKTVGLLAGSNEIPLTYGVFTSVWSTASSSAFSVIKVKSGDVIVIAGASVCGFLRSYTGVQNGLAIDYSTASGYTGRITSAGTYTTPSDAKFFIWRRLVNGSVAEPTLLTINGYDVYNSIGKRVTDLENAVSTNANGISALNTSVSTLNTSMGTVNESVSANRENIAKLGRDIIIEGDYEVISGGVETEATYISRTSGNIVAQSGYNTIEYDVSGLSKIKLAGKTAANELWIVYAFYSGTPSSSTLLEKVTIAELGGTSGVTLSIDTEVSVPSNATALVTCYYASLNDPVLAYSASQTTIKEYISKYSGALASISVWKDKTMSVYGDSVVQICNGDFIAPYAFDTKAQKRNWANYTAKFFEMAAQYGRGIGSQGYRWTTNVGYGGNVVFINSAGQYHSQNLNYTLDNYTGSVPSGCTAVRGCLASWKRITSQYPSSIKDSIDVVLVMAHNDSFSSDACAFVDDSTLQAMSDNSARDPEWMASGSDYYGKIGGDYNLQTFYGGIASTIMKLQMWMPQATIILLTGISGRGANGAADKINTAINSQGLMNNAEGVRTMGRLTSIPVIDTFATDGINGWNRLSYIYNDSDDSADIVHPYSEAGGKMFARAVIGGLKNILPLDVFK